MLGVVIWSNASDNKAIIWCEDNGELAFFGRTAQTLPNEERLGKGDLIQFDLTEYQNMRLAQNPRIIAGHFCSELDEVIARAAELKGEIEVAAIEPGDVEPYSTDKSIIEFDKALMHPSAARRLRQAG